MKWITPTTALVLQIFFSFNARTEDCESDTMKEISNNESCLYSASGKIFRIMGQDFIDPTTWHPGDKLLICPDSTSPNMRDIFRLHNLRLNGILVTERLPNASTSLPQTNDFCSD